MAWIGIPLSETHLRVILKSWVEHYYRGRPHSSLGPGVPDRPRDIHSGEAPAHILGVPICQPHKDQFPISALDCVWRERAAPRACPLLARVALLFVHRAEIELPGRVSPQSFPCLLSFGESFDSSTLTVLSPSSTK